MEENMNMVCGFPVPKNEEAPKVLLIGQPGAGKTRSLATLLEAGLKVYVIFTEQGKESLLQGVIDLKLTEKAKKNLFWTFVGTSTPGFKGLREFARKVNLSSQSDLQKEGSGVVPQEHQQLIEVIRRCENFVDQHGVEHGNISEFGNDCAVCIDGLSGINDMSMDLVVGAKPIKTIADWGIAMDTQMKFIKQFVGDLTCTFVLLAHLELNKDEVEGKIYKLPKLLGNKNSGDFGKYFSDVILAKDLGANWVWSTQENQMQLKTRNLKYSNKLEPSFVPLVTQWAKRYTEFQE